jgi:protein-L-isoaspartate(D-aspartate) O-methyltransferase
MAADSYTHERQAMVENDIKGRGVKDQKVLEVMGKIPRHLFVDENLRNRAYADYPHLSEKDRQSLNPVLLH